MAGDQVGMKSVPSIAFTSQYRKRTPEKLNNMPQFPRKTSTFLLLLPSPLSLSLHLPKRSLQSVLMSSLLQKIMNGVI